MSAEVLRCMSQVERSVRRATRGTPTPAKPGAERPAVLDGGIAVVIFSPRDGKVPTQ